MRQWLAAFVLILLIAGCAKQPVPEIVPHPMTEAYLLKKMQVVHLPHLKRTKIQPPKIIQHVRLADANATLALHVVIEDFDDPKKAPLYQIVGHLSGGTWGEFKHALDLRGQFWRVHPFTSSIRKGVYHETFYIVVGHEWFTHFAHNDPTLLLLGKTHELSITIAPVYLSAALTYYDRWRDQ